MTSTQNKEPQTQKGATDDVIGGMTSLPPTWHTLTPSRSEAEAWAQSLYEIVTTHRSLMDAHTVDFFTQSHWDNVIPERWKEELKSSGAFTNGDDILFPTTPSSDHESLHHFLYTVRSHSIPLEWGQGRVSVPNHLAQFGMTAKKSHEVDNFSRYITQLTSNLKITQVLDVGSGKGYLSQHLALSHGLCVVGVDAQITNTQGACRRNEKVYKAWKCVTNPHKLSRNHNHHRHPPPPPPPPHHLPPPPPPTEECLTRDTTNGEVEQQAKDVPPPPNTQLEHPPNQQAVKDLPPPPTIPPPNHRSDREEEERAEEVFSRHPEQLQTPHSAAATPTDPVSYSASATPTDPVSYSAAVTPTDPVSYSAAATPTDPVSYSAAATPTDPVSYSAAATPTDPVSYSAAATRTDPVSYSAAATPTDPVSYSAAATPTDPVSYSAAVTPTDPVSYSASATPTDPVSYSAAATPTDPISYSAVATPTDPVSYSALVTQTGPVSFTPLTQRISLTSGGQDEEPQSASRRCKGQETLLEAAERESTGRFVSQGQTCLVGLHTCGDLGGVALRLFLRQPQLRAVCIVGCCYHHITEKEDTGCCNDVGFPMSKFLKSHGAFIGRTGRMLACQAASRISLISSGAALESVFRRAVLQVLLQRKYPDIFAKRAKTLVIGRMRRTPRSFEEYVQQALQKLGLDKERVSSEEAVAVYGEFESKRSILSNHLKLRGVLASCVESLVLMDRLLFLHEQEGVRKIKLVQLFDPALSPRCFAISATKQLIL